MEVKLISQPDMGAVSLCEHAAAMCTQSDQPARALRGALRSGHDSVAEHAVFTFEIRGVSRVLLAQLTRHRIASFSVMSQRYVNQSGQGCIMPPSINANDDARELYQDAVGCIGRIYNKLIELGMPQEDARYILASGTTTDLIMTMNARELAHFFSLRCCNRAQWEIREMADKMLTILSAEFPELFGSAGPGCVRNACPEKRPCGHPRRADEWRQSNCESMP